QPGSPLPRPFADMTRGGRLFVSKGCVGCHRHQEINPERSSDARFDLTAKRFEHEYLKTFLANPAGKQVDMPNLNLKEGEIAALAAFINKFSAKQKQLERQK
ncbi:MAG: c-type cytochrome, partial [Acidobacteria bacterium]|nr:c-type cytochrome [Acidobacteriota bacterium]